MFGNDSRDRRVCNWFGLIYWNLVYSAIAAAELEEEGEGSGGDEPCCLEARVVEAGEGEQGEQCCEPHQPMAELGVAGELISDREQRVVQQLGETRDPETGHKGSIGGACLLGLERGFRLCDRQGDFQPELISGGGGCMATIANGGKELGVGSERGSQSFQTLQFKFQLVQFGCVLLLELRGMVPADESWGELNCGEDGRGCQEDKPEGQRKKNRACSVPGGSWRLDFGCGDWLGLHGQEDLALQPCC